MGKKNTDESATLSATVQTFAQLLQNSASVLPPYPGTLQTAILLELNSELSMLLKILSTYGHLRSI